jgi:macrodomain Ter protein organizer (MatP/YcbG family)
MISRSLSHSASVCNAQQPQGGAQTENSYLGEPAKIKNWMSRWMTREYHGRLDSYIFIRKQEYFNKFQAASRSWMMLRMEASAL